MNGTKSAIGHSNVAVKNSLNRRRPEMEAAVTTVLADSRLTAWDVFGDWWFFQASNRAEGPLFRPEAFPTAGGISDSRR